MPGLAVKTTHISKSAMLWASCDASTSTQVIRVRCDDTTYGPQMLAKATNMSYHASDPARGRPPIETFRR